MITECNSKYFLYENTDNGSGCELKFFYLPAIQRQKYKGNSTGQYRQVRNKTVMNWNSSKHFRVK